MDVATFGLEETLEQTLTVPGRIEPIRCAPEAPETGMLPGALEAAESALGSAAAGAALIAGDDDWALAAALACAKAVVPYAYVRAEANRENGNAGHIERLAATVIRAADGPAAVQRWLATFND